MGGSLWFLDCTMKENLTEDLLNEEGHFIDKANVFFFAKGQLIVWLYSMLSSLCN